MKRTYTPPKPVLFSRYAYTGDGQRYEDPEYHRYQPGDRFVTEAGAPGIGHTLYEITAKDESGFYAIPIRCTVRILSPNEVI